MLRKATPDEDVELGAEQDVPPWGHTTPVCGGYIKISRDWYMLVIVYFLVIVPVGFFARVAQLWVGVVAVLMAVVSLGLASVTSFMDPGIVPMKARDGQGPREDIIQTEPDGERVVLKWCHTCYIYRPPRASHCAMCGYCVEDFDHHCGIVGACVGKRNYRFFALFLWETTALAAWCFIWSCVNVHTLWRSKKYGKTPSMTAISGAMLLFYSFAVGTSLLSFGSYYCFLTCTDQTSKEVITGRSTRPAPPPPSRFAMFYRKIFGPIPASLIKNRPQGLMLE